MSNVVEFARAARLLKLKNAKKGGSFFRVKIDPKKGGVILSGDPMRGAHDLTEADLRRFADFFSGWAKILGDRRAQVEKAKKGDCALMFCHRKNWKGTGLCRSCAELMIGRAKGSR